MRKWVIDTFILGAIGVLLSVMGYPYYTWQYWIMVILILCYRLNDTDWEDSK